LATSAPADGSTPKRWHGVVKPESTAAVGPPRCDPTVNHNMSSTRDRRWLGEPDCASAYTELSRSTGSSAFGEHTYSVSRTAARGIPPDCLDCSGNASPGALHVTRVPLDCHVSSLPSGSRAGATGAASGFKKASHRRGPRGGSVNLPVLIRPLAAGL